MLHWPDNMVTWCPEEKILFSNDAFGQHYCTNTRFDDDSDFCETMQEAKKYYANIIMCYGKQAAGAWKIVKEMENKCKMKNVNLLSTYPEPSKIYHSDTLSNKPTGT
jgi:flavorubredoxin